MVSEKIAVVTGANKGIGFAIVKLLCKQLNPGTVYLTARDPAKGLRAVADLEKERLSPKFHLLDIISVESVLEFKKFLQEKHGGIDILINNAAIRIKPSAPTPYGDQAEETIRVNYYGTMRVCQEIFPLLRKGARVVNLSSSLGHLSQIIGQEPQSTEIRRQFSSPELTVDKISELMNTFVKLAREGTHLAGGWPESVFATYIVSKVGLCALTRLQQKEFDEKKPGDDIIVNSVHPGWVQTEMTGYSGPFTPDQGAEAPVWCALLPPSSMAEKVPRGEFVWYDKQIVDWANGQVPATFMPVSENLLRVLSSENLLKIRRKIGKIKNRKSKRKIQSKPYESTTSL